MEYLNNQVAYNAIIAMTDAEIVEMIVESNLNIPHDVVNGVLVNREMIIKTLTGINPNPNVRITYTYNGERTEQKQEAGSSGCRTCGG